MLGNGICSFYLEKNIFINDLRRRTLEFASEINSATDDSKLDGIKSVWEKKNNMNIHND